VYDALIERLVQLVLARVCRLDDRVQGRELVSDGMVGRARLACDEVRRAVSWLRRAEERSAGVPARVAPEDRNRWWS
jgi:hypothetical protein